MRKLIVFLLLALPVQGQMLTAIAGGNTPVATTPDGVAGLKLWLKADAGTSCGGDCTNNAAVTAWLDQSGQGNDPTVVGAPLYLTNQVNSLPAIKTQTAALSSFTLPNFCSGFTSVHGFLVVYPDVGAGAGSWSHPWGFGTAATGNYYTLGGTAYDDFGSTTRQSFALAQASVNGWHLYEISSASGAWTVWLDGTQVYTTATNTVGCSTAASVGYDGISAKGQVLGLAEAIIYDHALSDGDRAVVKSYIADRYGLGIN